jgi:hypothetical protein
MEAWPPEPPAPPTDERLWALTKGTRSSTCVLRAHPLGVEVRVDVDGEAQMTQVHRLKADACIDAAALEDAFLGKGWISAGPTQPSQGQPT